MLKNKVNTCGDEAIMQLCDIICGVFSHSPVFRYGGDEFVILLQNRDLHNAERLIKRFYSITREFGKDKDANPWLKFGAAIGYAVYNPAVDADVSSVFDRADRAMYEKKEELKRKN